MAKPALGRGLGALLGATSANRPATTASTPERIPQGGAERVERVAISSVQACPFQPRKDFSAAALQELADSIREQGIIQPLIVRRRADHFELIAGERRWRAAQLAGLTDVPVIVREADDRTVLELALIENLQRENLNPIEEALGFAQLIDQFQLKQEEAATKVGKSRAVVANALRLLKLDPELQTHIREGRLSVGHAKVILSLPDPSAQRAIAEQILAKALSVRQTEELVSRQQQQPPSTVSAVPVGPAPPNLHVSYVENKLQEKFGTKVQLRYRHGKGSIDIRFFNDEDLDRVLGIIGLNLD